MRQPDNTRCYQSFPSVIPVCRASSLRVTHPSALARLRKRSFANDLHVLSILSAFILSQDQTLHSIYFSYILFTLVLTSFLPYRQVLLTFIYILHIVASSILIFYCPATLFRIDKIYIIISPPLCQLLFSIFLKFFSYVYHTVKCNTCSILKNIVKIILQCLHLYSKECNSYYACYNNLIIRLNIVFLF